MVKHSQLFIDSLLHPKKLAGYRLLSIGKTIQYVFLLVALVTLFSFIQFLTGVSEVSYNIEGLTEYIEDIQWLLYPFALLLLILTTTILLFVRISIYALVGVVILKVTNKRGEYRHMWRTATFAVTWSTLLSIVFTTLQFTGAIPTLIGIVITVFLLIIAATKYPKIPKK
ncbi:uncharacterized protein DUF1189 [Ureibacillus xyleni]|uniref:Uncharacterized protein DUF1189 n=1 Tax=Ureibacillus xyleni TaxID=614648 RepID=A0A285TGC8_9BACL|nr:DUF1189 family protein [Ureibacillus xyleni]SOC21027.1 uncharacterized protein DUF1189 [Ureibacillus xyleni]